MSRSLLYNKIAVLRQEINSVEARQECKKEKMHIPKYDITMEVLSERLKIAEKELKATEDIFT